MKKQLTWALVGTTSFLISLAVTAPLPILAQQLRRFEPNMQLAGVSGTLWNGKIQQMVTPKATVSDLSWTFAPRQLLRGYMAADIKADIKTLQVQGQCGISLLTNVKCDALVLNMPAADIAQLSPKLSTLIVQLGGDLRAKLETVEWDRQTLPRVNGELIWSRASVDQPLKVDLKGEYNARIKPSDKLGEALNVTMLSTDAMIVLDGKVLVEPDGHYQAELFLKPAADASPSLAQALDFIGARQADGSVRIKQDGQLPYPKVQPKEPS